MMLPFSVSVSLCLMNTNKTTRKSDVCFRSEKGEKKTWKKENAFFRCFCQSSSVVVVYIFLSFSILKRVIILSLTCREEDDGTDCSFPPASSFSFSFSSSLR